MTTSVPRYEIGMKALLPTFDGQNWRYLFLQRTDVFEGEDQPRWDIPGGRVRPRVQDTNLRTGLAREVLEETGLHLDPSALAPLQIQTIHRRPSHPDVIRVTNLVTVPLGRVALSDEHSAYDRLTRAQALALNIDPYLRAVLTTEANFEFEKHHEPGLNVADMLAINRSA